MGMEEVQETDSGFVEDKDLSLLRTLTDEELVKACGGRTAHKGGRHGHRMNAKLARIEKAEAEYMQNHKSKEEKSAANRLEEGADDCAPEVKKKKKKRKREKDLDETIAEPGTIDVIKCDGEEENIENEEPDGEIKTKKRNLRSRRNLMKFQQMNSRCFYH